MKKIRISRPVSILLGILLLLCSLCLCGCNDEQLPTEPTVCQSHVDSDADLLCDVCETYVVVTFDLYAVNDLHGKIADADTHPGVDELTTYLKDARETDENMILLSAGDMWQGSSESNMTKGLLTTDWMNDIGFAAMTLGNHEFDWGEDPITENFHTAQFPFLAINIFKRADNTLADYCQPSVMIDLGQLQVGIIGAIGDCYSSIAANKVEDIYFKVGNELTELVMAESNALREKGADYIIYVLHDGYGQSKSASATSINSSQLASYYDTDLSNGYVDLVFEGHTHQRYILVDDHGVYHLQNKGDNKGISHVEVAFNLATGESDIQSAELVSTGVYANMEDDPIVEQLLAKYDQAISPASEILGTNAVQRERNELRQTVADLYYELGIEAWGDKYDIALGGGFISVRSPGYLAAGEVTYGMLQSLFPFDNDLVLCSIRGRDLQSRFFETSNDNYFISYGDYGEQLKNNIDPNGIYYVVVDTYSSSYAPNNLTVVEEYALGFYARDMLADHIRAGEME